VHTEEHERPDHDRGHDDERPVEDGVVLAVGVVGVRDVPREVLVRARVALLARLDPMLAVQAAARIMELRDVVMAVVFL
jgi:hypothetical protein